MIDLNKIGKLSGDWGKWFDTGNISSIFRSFSKQYKKALKLRKKWWKVSMSYQCLPPQKETESVGKKITEYRKEYSSVMMNILVEHLKICGADFGDIETELKKKLAEKD